MLAQERHDRIFKLIQQNGAVTTSSLMSLFQVSIETIRRDLLSMEQAGQIRRVHGGAVAKSDMQPYFDLEKRHTEFREQKLSLSKTAMQFISEGDVIAIDSGSTAVLFTDVLKEQFSQLTIVTHCHEVFLEICDHPGFDVILCGGHYCKDEKAFIGALPMEILNLLHVQKAFIFPSAVSLEFGICDYQRDLFSIQQQLLRIGDEIFILADSRKFEKRGLLKISNMSAAYTYVTDQELPDELYHLYQENGIRIHRGR